MKALRNAKSPEEGKGPHSRGLILSSPEHCRQGGVEVAATIHGVQEGNGVDGFLSPPGTVILGNKHSP